MSTGTRRARLSSTVRNHYNKCPQSVRICINGVQFVVSDDHDGLKKAIAECLSTGAWQRCYVHFLRNAIEHLPRKRDDDCLQELRWLYDRLQLKEAKADLRAWIKKWQARYSKLVAWVEDNIEE